MDPYKVLGVSYDATEDEIKSAYRKLSRMYHPDANVGKPNQKELEEKFKEVQQAYSMIMDQKQGKTTAQGQYGYGGYGQGAYGNGHAQGYDGQDFQEFWEQFFGFGAQGQGQRRSAYQGSQDEQYINSALNYIKNGYYREGLNVLEQIPKEKRQAEWFYYSAFANYKTGNNVIAQEHAKAACALEPNNMEYRRLLEIIQGGGSRYQERSGRYGGNPTMGKNNYCMNALCTMACMSLCCGGGGFVGMPILCCI